MGVNKDGTLAQQESIAQVGQKARHGANGGGKQRRLRLGLDSIAQNSAYELPAAARGGLNA